MLVGVVLGYSLLGTLLTVLIGRRLVGLNFNQLRYEADFRYSLVTENCRSLASTTSASATAGASWIITIMFWNCGDRINGNC
jgi:ABC-type long-subunit fatty acid transport system fused permease/ATPase subunit